MKFGAALVVLAALTAACGGSRSIPANPQAPPLTGAPVANAVPVAFELNVPQPAANDLRRLAYIPPSTASISLTMLQWNGYAYVASLRAVADCTYGAQPVVLQTPVSAPSGTSTPYPTSTPFSTPTPAPTQSPTTVPTPTPVATPTASAPPGAAKRCAISTALDPNYYVVAITLLDKSGGNGNVVAQGQQYFQVQAGQANTIALTLSVNIASYRLVLGAPIANGVATAIPMTPEFRDPSGATIVPSAMPTAFYVLPNVPSPLPSPALLAIGAAQFLQYSSAPFFISPYILTRDDLIAGKTFTLSYSGAELPTGQAVAFGATIPTYFLASPSPAPFVTTLIMPAPNPPAFSVPTVGTSATFAKVGNTVEGSLPDGTARAVGAFASTNTNSTTSPTTIPAADFTIEARGGTVPFGSLRGTTSVVVHHDSVAAEASLFRDVVITQKVTAEYHRVPASGIRRPRTYVPPPSVGAHRTFTILQFPIDGSTTGTNIDVPFTLRLVGLHALIWTDDSAGITDTLVAQNETGMETAYASDTAHFGLPSYDQNSVGNYSTRACDASGVVVGTTPIYGPDSRPDQINVLLVAPSRLGAGVGGYFDSGAFVSQAALNCNTTSTHANKVGGPAIVLGSFYGVAVAPGGLAHELQHLIHFVNHVIVYGGGYDPSFIDEGMAGVADEIASAKSYSDAAKAYIANASNVSLALWRGTENGRTGSGCNTCYGGGYLFAKYMADRFGIGVLKQLTQTGLVGYANLAAVAGVPSGETILSDFYGMLAVGGNPADGDVRFKFRAYPLTVASPTATIPIGGGPIIIHGALQGAPTFVQFTGSGGAVIRAHDDSGTLRLFGSALRY